MHESLELVLANWKLWSTASTNHGKMKFFWMKKYSSVYKTKQKQKQNSIIRDIMLLAWCLYCHYSLPQRSLCFSYNWSYINNLKEASTTVSAFIDLLSSWSKRETYSLSSPLFLPLGFNFRYLQRSKWSAENQQNQLWLKELYDVVQKSIYTSYGPWSQTL